MGGEEIWFFFLAACFLKKALEMLYSVSVQIFVMHEYVQYEHTHEQILGKELIQFPFENVIYLLYTWFSF